MTKLSQKVNIALSNIIHDQSNELDSVSLSGRLLMTNVALKELSCITIEKSDTLPSISYTTTVIDIYRV